MATLCNYTHHELHNTSGLQRHGHGVLFPYNPEFYDRASGLYGPGTIIAWNLLFVSLVINTIVPSFPDKEPAQHNFWSGMSGELVTFVAFPMFAATDLLVHGIKLIDSDYEHRDSALYCLRNLTIANTTHKNEKGVEYTQHPLNLADIPPDILNLGQRVIEVLGPLDVSYSFFSLVPLFTMVILDVHGPKPAAALFLAIGMTYVVLLLFIFHCTLGSFSTGIFFIPWGEFVRLVWKLMSIILMWVDLLAAGATVAVFGRLFWGLWLRDNRPMRALLAELAQIANDGLFKLLLAISGVPFVGYTLWELSRVTLSLDTLRHVWVPDLGIPLLEQDQLAALIASSLSLCYTLYCAVRKVRMDTDADAGDTMELRDSLLPGPDAHDVEALAGARRVSTM